VEGEFLSKTNTVIKLKVKVNDGPVSVYRLQGQRYNSQYMSICKRSSRVSVHCWGCISHEGAGVPHRIEGHLDGLQYQHNLQNVTVPSVWMLYPDDIIHLQQNHSSIHDSSSSLRNTHHSQRTHPCHRWDWNPQSQQATGRRPPGHWDRRSIAPTH